MTLLYKLNQAKWSIQSVIDHIERMPDGAAMADLIEACINIDNNYKRWCSEMDEGSDQIEGTTYEEGIFIEYEIEASDWHDVSLALRKIKGVLNP